MYLAIVCVCASRYRHECGWVWDSLDIYGQERAKLGKPGWIRMIG